MYWAVHVLIALLLPLSGAAGPYGCARDPSFYRRHHRTGFVVYKLYTRCGSTLVCQWVCFPGFLPVIRALLNVRAEILVCEYTTAPANFIRLHCAPKSLS